MMSAQRITNAMSVDVEDYFQVSAFEAYVERRQWDNLPWRVERNIDRVLTLFAECEVKATFFTLGWVAERFPDMVRRIVQQGHELASHGYSHVRVHDQNPQEFAADVGRSKALLEDIGGVPIRGYRAASYSIGRDNLWALDVLAETGHAYSSSIYPIHHDLYGMAEAPRFPFRNESSGILEIPISTVRVLRRNFPCGGGGFFRFYPYRLSRWAIRHVNDVERRPTVFYFHPWEIDTGQPKQKGLNTRTRIRHYLNIGRMERRLGALMRDFDWHRLDHVYLNGADTSP